jgi:hypothetical protein
VHTRGAVDAVESLAQVVEQGRLLVSQMMRQHELEEDLIAFGRAI